MNNMDVLNEYFARFGPVSALQINHNRHEAIISFSRLEDAEEVLRHPVLNDPSIGLRPWRSKAGQRGPHESPVLEASDRSMAALVGGPGGADAAGMGARGGAAGRPAPGAPQGPQLGNMMLESGTLLEKKRKREEIEDKRRALLQGLTDQLKVIMARISDPKTTEKNRTQWQAMLASIKDKITALTPPTLQPVQPPPMEQEPPRQRPLPPTRPAPGMAQAHYEPRRPPALRLLDLPAELRGADAEVRLGQALGEGVAAVLMWSEDGTSCVVRFTERRHAEAALQAQKVWGFTAEWFGHGEEAPEATDAPEGTEAASNLNVHHVPGATPAVAAAGMEDTDPPPDSPETEAMDSDVPDQELMGAMAAGLGDEEFEGIDIVPEAPVADLAELSAEPAGDAEASAPEAAAGPPAVSSAVADVRASLDLRAPGSAAPRCHVEVLAAAEAALAREAVPVAALAPASPLSPAAKLVDLAEEQDGADMQATEAGEAAVAA